MSAFKEYLKKVGEVGHVQSSNQVLVACTGLVGATIGEKVYFEKGQIGFVNAFDAKVTEILILDENPVELGSMVVRTGEALMVEAAEELLGQVLDPFGVSLEKKVKLGKISKRYLENAAPAMIDRVRIDENMETGVMVADLLIPIGKGQRQLVIGDQKTGKTNFLIQTIARQAELGTICIYVMIGKKKSDLTSTIEKLKKFGALERTIVVAAPSSIPTSLIYLSPFTAFAIAEYFRDKGVNVLLILDEISRHARYYRELSILSKKMPGRDGYPGDIFYLHSHLMERAGRFATGEVIAEQERAVSQQITEKTASITCLPVVETLNGDFTGYVQTNLMSMTDGHIFFDMNQFQDGIRPAININLSVTRIGKQTHTPIERNISLKVREVLFEYAKARDVAKFGVELLQVTQERIKKGERLFAVFDQGSEVIIPKIMQLMFIEMLLGGFWADYDTLEIKEHKVKLLAAYKNKTLEGIVKQLTSAFELGALARFEDIITKSHGELFKVVNGK